jgi:hypothetical protein
MEATMLCELLSVLIIAIPILVIIIMEKFLYRKDPTQEEIDDYQNELDKESRSFFKCFGILRKFDARYEILRERRQQKIFIGFNLAIIYLSLLMLFALTELYSANLKIALIFGIFISAFFAIFNGIKPQLKKLTGLT